MMSHDPRDELVVKRGTPASDQPTSFIVLAHEKTIPTSDNSEFPTFPRPSLSQRPTYSLLCRFAEFWYVLATHSSSASFAFIPPSLILYGLRSKRGPTSVSVTSFLAPLSFISKQSY